MEIYPPTDPPGTSKRVLIFHLLLFQRFLIRENKNFDNSVKLSDILNSISEASIQTGYFFASSN